MDCSHRVVVEEPGRDIVSPLTRKATAADQSLLMRATLENLNWNGERFTPDDLQRQEFRHYFEGWPGAQDFGFVAESVEGRPVGVVWLRFFTEADPGYGFVQESIPELSIWVDASHRGQGLGLALVQEAIREARVRELDGISLSVEAGNPARKLYERVGFLAGAELSEGTLILRL